MEQITIESTLLEEWLRTAFVDDDGQIFLPCGAMADERSALLCLSFDGVPMVQHEGHVYAPADWLAGEYPRYAKTIETIVANIQRRLHKK